MDTAGRRTQCASGFAAPRRHELHATHGGRDACVHPRRRQQLEGADERPAEGVQAGEALAVGAVGGRRARRVCRRIEQQEARRWAVVRNPSHLFCESRPVRRELLARLRRPHPHAAVVGAAREQPTVRDARHAPHRRRVAAERIELRGARRQEGPVGDGAVVRCGEQPTRARAVADGLDLHRVQRRELEEEVARRDRPDEDVRLV